MFSLREFKHRFEVPARSLCRDWKAKFLTSLKNEKDRTVNSKTGVILSVKEFKKIHPPVMHNGKIIVDCIFTGISFLPEIQQIYQGTITLILPLGILIEVDGMVKVLIQSTNLPSGYKFIPIRKVFGNETHTYQVGDKIHFKILNIRYKPGEVNCIGSLKDIPLTQVEENEEKDVEFTEEIFEDMEEDTENIGDNDEVEEFMDPPDEFLEEFE